MIFIFFKFFFMVPAAWADNYLVEKRNCRQEGGIRSEDVYHVSPEILLNCHHHQGNTGTCSYHTMTALLTALYKSTRQSIGDHDNLDVLDLMRQLNGNFEHGVDLISSLFKIKQKIQYVSEHCGVTIQEYERRLVHQKDSLSTIFQDKEFKQHQLPEFRIKSWAYFESPDAALQVIKNHFNSADRPSDKPLLPLALVIQQNSTRKIPHATLVTSLIETTCRNGTTQYSVMFQNSYGARMQGPFDLNALTQGMTKGVGKVIELIPSESSCEASPVYTAAAEGKLSDLKSALQKNRGHLNGVCGSQVPLWIAVCNGHLEIVEFLIRKNASLDVKVDGDNLITVAYKTEHFEIMKILIQAQLTQGKSPVVQQRDQKMDCLE